MVKSALLVAGLSVASFAGTLTENVSFDMGDVNYIFGGMVVAGVALYAIRKAKSLLGA
jgi:hypothetical protein